jgi:hypothetical protein
LPIERGDIEGNLVWLYVTPDGCSLYCSQVGGTRDKEAKFEKGNLMVWWRASPSDPFADYRYIEIDGLPPLTGNAARYVAATNELFFSRDVRGVSGQEGGGGIWVVKNFVPPVPTHE